MFGISESVRSRGVQVCTPELFHQATRSSLVKDVCAQLEDALESKRRGEISQDDYNTMKTNLKARLPILTPHATFRNGRRLNADAVPSGLSIYDKDHIPNPRGWWEEKRKLLAEKSVLDSIVLVHVTPSTEGLRLVFVISEGMDLAGAQKWMNQQLEDDEYDSCVKDLARPSFLVPEDYILFINEEELFRDRSVGNSFLPQISQITQMHSAENPAVNNSTDFRPVRSVISQIQGKGNDAESVKSVKSVGESQMQGKGNNAESVKSVKSVGESQMQGKGNNAESVKSVGESQMQGSSENLCDNNLDRDSKSVKLNAQVASENDKSVKSVKSVGEKTASQVFPTEYQGIPYKSLVDKLVELLGGAPEHGSRNSFIFSLACYLRYLCDDNAAWIKQVIPTFGEQEQRAFTTVESACNRKQSHRMPNLVRTAIKLATESDEKARAEGGYDADDFGDINNPESFFYHIHEMPKKLPKLIRLLISKTPRIYQPAVSQAVFPPLAAHLCDTRFLYIDNVEHEATLMNILCAPTGSGKESITQPINRIMQDIRLRDAEQRVREREWKDECNRKGSNKDKRERPQGLVIQEVNIDMTNPAFVLRMKEAENHFLYAKVNELNLFDALKGKTNQHFRIMELAFDLGNYGQDRVGTQSVTETIKVRFNWNACCTPKKCRDYFRRVVTDGPISRISFATIERRPCGSEIPVYGTYDAAFDEELRPYIENLVKARGLIDCPQAIRLARKLVEENAEFARLSQNYVFENLSFRANVIAYLKACVLYVANGMKWEKSIEDFIRWSERYDLWCKLKLFGQMIYDADNDRSDQPKTAPRGPKNLLEMLPDEFTMEDYIKLRMSEGFDNTNVKTARLAINQWTHRGYVVRLEEGDDNDNYSFKFRKLKFRKDGNNITKKS